MILVLGRFVKRLVVTGLYYFLSFFKASTFEEKGGEYITKTIVVFNNSNIALLDFNENMVSTT